MLIVLVGNIGTGKSTYANEQKKLNSNIKVICFDKIYDKYQDYEITFKKVGIKIESGLDVDMDVIVDGMNLDRKIRGRLVSFAKRKNKHSNIIDFGIGDESTLQRRIDNSPEVSAEEWRKWHIENQRLYEKPSIDEYYDEICFKYSQE